MEDIMWLGEFVKNNPFKTVTGILAIISALSTGVYQLYSTGNEILDNYATKEDVFNSKRSTSLEILDVSIMNYEDNLMILDFKIEDGVATNTDKADKRNIVRRLQDLKQKRTLLENKKYGEHN